MRKMRKENGGSTICCTALGTWWLKGPILADIRQAVLGTGFTLFGQIILELLDMRLVKGRRVSLTKTLQHELSMFVSMLVK